MTDRDALFAAICAHPDEDTPRLALADFLDEQGGKENAFRADLVRTHCRLAREEPWSVPWRELNDRWQKLLDRALDLARRDKLPWVAHLRGRVRAWQFERGLVGHLTLFSKRFVAEGGSYFETDPVRSVKFVKLNSAAGSVRPSVLFACPHLARAARLDFDGSGLADADLARLGDSPHAAGLRALGLGGDNRFTRAAIPKLLKSLPALSELSFTANDRFGDAHARELAGCPEFARVSLLDLTHAGVKAAGVEALAGSPHAAGLRVLRLTPELVYDEEHGGTFGTLRGSRADGLKVAGAVAGSKSLGGLQELALNDRNIGDDGLRLIAASGALPALRRLNVEGCGLTVKGVSALADSAPGRRLLYLNLQYNPHLARHAKKLPDLFPDAHVEAPFAYVD